MQACNHEGMQMMRRVLLLGMLLLIPVLLATAGAFLSAPSGPPAVDATPVELGPGPDGTPAHGLEPVPGPSPSGAASGTGDVPRTQTETPPAAPPVQGPPAAPVPAPPADPVPVLPPVVIDDDDDGDDDGADDDGAGEDNDQ